MAINTSKNKIRLYKNDKFLFVKDTTKKEYL